MFRDMKINGDYGEKPPAVIVLAVKILTFYRKSLIQPWAKRIHDSLLTFLFQHSPTGLIL